MQQLRRLTEKLEAIQLDQVSPEAFDEWQGHPITQRLMLHFRMAQLEAVDELMGEQQPERCRAAINAYEELLEWRPDDE